MEINLTEGGVLSIIKESPHNGLTLQLLNLSPLRSSFNSAIQHRVDLSDGDHIQPALLPSKFAGHVLDKTLQEGSIVLLRKYVCRNYNKDLTVLITDMDNIVSTWPRQGTPVPVPEHILRGKETVCESTPPAHTQLSPNTPACDRYTTANSENNCTDIS
ncbi:hypothetical protein KI387_041630, partial [Taxus chinensis]